MSRLDIEHPLSARIRAANAAENARADAARRSDGEALMRRIAREEAAVVGPSSPVRFACAWCGWSGTSADEQLRHAATHPRPPTP